MIRLAFSAPRHPLARIAMGLAGLAVLALLSVFGLALAALAMAAVAGRAAWLALRGESRPLSRAEHDPQVIDGEFKVIEAARLPPRV